MADPIADYRRAAGGFAAVLAGATDLTGPAPCEGWTGADVVDHVLGGTRLFLGAFGADVPADADGDLPATYEALRTALADAAARPGALDGMLPSPFGGELPAPVLLGIFTTDTLLHTWDLAKATGQDATLDPDLLERSWQGALPMDEAIRRPGVFGPKVDVGEDAPRDVQALAFFGRDAR